MDFLKKVKVFTEMPEGWREIKNAVTAPKGFIWICNGKSRFSGEYVHALLKKEVVE